MTPAPRVGYVGLGSIGGPMALRLARSGQGIELWVHDVVASSVAEAEAAGARVAATVGGLAREVDVVCVMVRDDDQVRSVVDEVVDAGRAVRVVVHSTVAPGTPSELAERALPHGVRVLDAPVSGGAAGAADGSLAIMVGGDAADVEAVRPVLDVLGSKVVHAGPVGAGTAFKLARNLLHFVAFTAATEAQRLAEAAGLSLRDLGDVVRHTDAITGGPGAIMHRDTTADLAPDDFWHGVLGHVTALGEKDLGHAVDLAHRLGVDVPLAELAAVRLGPGLGLPGDPTRKEH